MDKLKELIKLFWVFFKIGLLTFGGGYVMIPLIEKEAVEKNGWVKKEDIADIVVIAESTPGPIAVNAATFVGYRHMGFWGALSATFGLVLPSFIIILLIAVTFGFVKDNKWIGAALWGIRAGVTALLINAVISLSKLLDKSLAVLAVFLAAFFLATFVKVSVIYIILAGGVFGLAWQSLRKEKRPETASVPDGGTGASEENTGAGEDAE